MTAPQINSYVKTPRFHSIKIKEIFTSKEDARESGYTEPTNYRGEFEVFGRFIDINRMDFAAVVSE